MLCYVHACGLCTLILLHLFLDLCEVERFLCSFFVFQFIVVNKLWLFRAVVVLLVYPLISDFLPSV